MSEKSVHPFHFSYPDGSQEFQQGMTLREYYAGQALQGLLAGRNNPGTGKIIRTEVARRAVQHADDLIKQLDNEETTKPG